ncbi:hypothetical protein [Streptomyces sp. NPDC018031]|uniref:hypothetical protein n=1 Tax=Streptomyces sp. NPDC018031 TaxID=3365033 RepID=UPI0037B68C23
MDTTAHPDPAPTAMAPGGPPGGTPADDGRDRRRFPGRAVPGTGTHGVRRGAV